MFRPNRVSGVGDVNLPGDLTIQQMQTAAQAYQSGALSSAGYNQILSGNVASANFSDFLAADPGVPQSLSIDPSILVIAGIFVVALMFGGASDSYTVRVPRR